MRWTLYLLSATWLCLIGLATQGAPAQPDVPVAAVETSASKAVAESAQQPDAVSRDKSVVQVSTFWSATAVKPGGQITLAVVLAIQKPYHLQSDTAKDPFVPTTVQLTQGPGFLIGSTPVFPPAQELLFGPAGARETVKVFSDRVVAFLPFGVGQSAKPGAYEVKIQVGYQACDDTLCLLPTDSTTNIQLTVAGAETEVQSLHPEIFQELSSLRDRLNIPFFGLDFQIKPSRLSLLLCIALIGGFFLNFTPCVLPLVPIKMMGLAKAAGNRRRCLLLGFAMAGGVVAFWLALAVAITTITGFNATNKLFQYPAFTVSVGLIIVVMAVGMSGVFTIGLPQWIYRFNPSQDSVIGSVLFGVMTAVLSTPCTAPFMGAAAAWSATQAPIITMSTFAAIGAGMALPYLVLAGFPALVRHVPRSGPVSELIKQVMGLLMLAAGAYFLGTGLAGMFAKPPDPPTTAYWWAVAFFIGAAGGWLLWRVLRIVKRTTPRIISAVLGLGFVSAGALIGLRFTQKSPIHWIYFTPERLALAKKESKVVVLEFTAAWCLNCHALEQTVLSDPNVIALLNAPNVAPIKVDITGNNSAGNAKLIEAGRRTIPYLVIYSPRGEEILASDAYTVDQIVAGLGKAAH